MTAIEDRIMEYRKLVQDSRKEIYDAELLLATDLAYVDMEGEKFTKLVDIDASTVKVNYYLKSKPLEYGGRPIKTVIYYQRAE